MPWKELKAVNLRKQFVLEATHTQNFRQLCREYGISPKTGYKWKQRFLSYGLEAMGDASRRPKRSPTGLSEDVCCEIARLKMSHLTWGPRKLRAVYARSHSNVPSESSFKRILDKVGLVKARRFRKRSEAGRVFTGRKAQAANDVWTVDFKGWWYCAGNQKCEPLTVRDEFSRYVLELRTLEDARTQTVRECFERLFEIHGLPGAIRSDNGTPFANTKSVLGLTALSAWWVALGIDLERGRPRCPQDNGAHERLHLDVHNDLETKKRGQYQAELDAWRREFNEERPHEALAMRRPVEVYSRSKRPFEGTPADLKYARMPARKVTMAGHICWEGQHIFISCALRGWSVGLEHSQGHTWKVWFGRLLLGEVDSATASFKPIRKNGEAS